MFIYLFRIGMPGETTKSINPAGLRKNRSMKSTVLIALSAPSQIQSPGLTQMSARVGQTGAPDIDSTHSSAFSSIHHIPTTRRSPNNSNATIHRSVAIEQIQPCQPSNANSLIDQTALAAALGIQ
jgi:hypothetical protein